MARQELRAGEIDTVQVITLLCGRFQVRARLFDELGKLNQFKASDAAEALAETELREKADVLLNDTGGPTFSKDVTIGGLGSVPL